ncbi:MAG: hypothetical protein ACRERC_08620 [Candidatus Binatia bacterium]
MRVRRRQVVTVARQAVAKRWWVLFAGLALVALWHLDRLGHGRIFFYDEWSWVLQRRSGAEAWLLPHNGHLVAAPVALYQLLFALVGLTNYRVFLLAGSAVHIAAAALAAIYARRRAGDVAGLAVAAVVLFLGSAWQDVLWPFQITLMGSVAAGLGAYLLLDAERPRPDVGAAALLALGLACSSIGLAMSAGAAARLLVARQWRRLWIPAAGLVGFLAWTAVYGEAQGGLGTLAVLPGYIAKAFASSLAAIGGIDAGWGGWLGLAFLVALVGHVWRARRLPPALAGLVAAALTFWSLTAYARGQYGEPSASRYLYVGAILSLLALAEVLGRRAWRGRSIVLVGAAALAVWGNADDLRFGASTLHDNSIVLRAALAGLELAGADVDPAYCPDPQGAPSIRAGQYFAAIAALGSPAEPYERLPRMPALARQAADRVLLEARPPSVAAGGADPQGRLQVEGAAEARCAQAVAGAALTVVVPPAGLAVIAPARTSLRLRRFADTWYDAVSIEIAPGRPQVLRLPSDASPVPWRARVNGPAVVCAARAE